jgi:hypothetical protein
MNNMANKLQRILQIGVTNIKKLSTPFCIIHLLMNSRSLKDFEITSNESTAKAGSVTKILKVLKSCGVSISICEIKVASEHDLLNLLSSQPSLKYLRCEKLVGSTKAPDVMSAIIPTTLALTTFMIHFSQGNSCVELLDMLSRSKNLKHLHLEKLVANDNTELIETILMNSRKLEYLVIGTSHRNVFERGGVSSQVHEDARMYNIIKRCSELRHLRHLSVATVDFNDHMATTIATIMPHLVDFHWFATRFQVGTIESLFQSSCPHLESLVFVNRNMNYGQPGYHDGTHTERGQLHYDVIRKACPVLCTLTAPDLMMLPSYDMASGINSKSLIHLSVRFSYDDFEKKYLRLLLEHYSNLEDLRIYGEQINASDFLDICVYGINLCEIEIGFKKFVYDEVTHADFLAAKTHRPSHSLLRLHMEYLQHIFPKFLTSFFYCFESVIQLEVEDLSISTADIIVPWNIEEIYSEASKIASVSFVRCYMDRPSLLAFFKAIADVEALSLFCFQTSLDALIALLGRLKSLELLSVSRCESLAHAQQIIEVVLPNLEIEWTD